MWDYLNSRRNRAGASHPVNEEIKVNHPEATTFLQRILGCCRQFTQQQSILLFYRTVLHRAACAARRVCHNGKSARGEENGAALIEDMAREIMELNASTEEEFLQLGSKLQGIYQNSREVSRISATVAELLSGEQITGSISGLREVFARVEDLEAQSKRYAEVLDHLREVMGKVGASLVGFHRFVQKLNVYCTSTRIESSRLRENDMGFDTLSDDINKLAGEVEIKTASILERLETLNVLIRENLRKVQELESRQRGGTRTILDNTRASLASLEQKHELSRAAAERIAACFGELSEIIGEIVSSIQFHDITRQQMEHVAESLTNQGSAAAEAPGLELSVTAGDICELQSIQLRHASGKLTGAVDEIIKNLGATARKVEDITKGSLQIAGDAENTDSSSLCGLEERIKLIASALGDYGKAGGDLASTMGSITEAVADMSTFVVDIERIGVAIKLIALNAVVKAAHLGEDGAALGVIADAIHSLSFDTGQETSAITEAFQSVIAYSEQSFSGAGFDGSRNGETVEEMASGLGQLTTGLREINKDVSSKLALLEKTGRNLLKEIEETAFRIHVHERVSETAERIASKLDETVAHIRESAPASGSMDAERRAELLRELEKSYTMNSEREIHQLATASKASDLPENLPGLNATEADENTADDLGDNVELF